MLNALNLIIKKLTQAVFEEEGGAALLEDRKKEILLEIKKELGHNHPIAILVEMTSRYGLVKLCE